jgi:RNA polymerase sigma factor (sigma-70 family)
MAKNRNITQEEFDAILSWLDDDRDLAGARYEQLRRSLIRILGWHSCSDAEGLADEVINRVASKVHEVKPTYVGDPRLYFYAVANNVAKEQQKQSKLQVPIDDADVASILQDSNEAYLDHLPLECFHKCLRDLGPENRQLILDYYQMEKQAKINHRKEMAARLGIELTALRVRMYRIRITLDECIERCLNEPANDMD